MNGPAPAPLRTERVAAGAAPDAARVVVVHGNDLCGAHYRGLAHALAARGVTSDLVTLPGFAGVPPLARPSWDALVDALLAHCARDPPAALVGHSMGGLVTLLAAARAPTWLRALVLLEPAVFPSRGIAALAARRYQRVVLAASPDAPFQNTNGGQRRIADLSRYPQELLALHAEVRRTSDGATARALFSSWPELYPLPLAQVRAPALLVRGARAGLLSRWQVGTLARALGAPTVVIPHAAHWLFGEADEAVADAVAPFVRG